jgi:hypothetical protein
MANGWWFFAPFILFIPIAVFLAIRHVDEKKYSLLGLIILGLAGWALLNVAEFLIYIIPRSGWILSNPFSAIPAVVSGLLLYRLRGKHPFFYGGTEVCVSLLAILVSIGSDSSDPLNKLVGILGGVYILVRGFDNLDKGLPSSWRGRWDSLFPKPQPKEPLSAESANRSETAERGG